MAYPTNYNTPEMLANSRRLYGGYSPGASRTGIDYQQPTGQRVPNPAYYQQVPGAPPPAPPPAYYMQRQTPGVPQPSGILGGYVPQNSMQPPRMGLGAAAKEVGSWGGITPRPPQPTMPPSPSEVFARSGQASMGGGMQLPGPAASMGPPPASVNNGRPDFPTLGAPSPFGWASMGSGMQLPSLPLVGPQPSGPVAPRPDFPSLPQLAPSGQPMVNGPGYSAPPPQGVQFGPPVPPNYDPQAPIRRLQADGVIGSRVGQPGQGPGPMPPLSAALLGGQSPITGPTGASMATAAGPMTNSQAFDNYRNSPADSKYMPGMTVGGRYGLNGPGVDPNSPDTLKRISDAQNVARLGNGREAILASLNRSGYKAPPDKQHDFGLVNSGKFNEGGQRKEAYSPSETQKINDAKALLSSPERQKYLADRKATVDARKAERAPAVQAKAMAKTEARRFRQGIMSNADRLAFMNPTAAAQRDVGKAQVAAASARDRANDATNRDRIASGERIAQGRDKTAQQVSRDRVAAAYAANGIEPPTEGTKQNGQALDDNVYANMGPQEALDHMRKAGIPADEINARMNRVFASRSQGGHNWYTNPEGPGARGPVPPPQPKPKNYPPDVGPNAPQPEPTTNPKPTNGRAFTPRRRPGGSTSF